MLFKKTSKLLVNILMLPLSELRRLNQRLINLFSGQNFFFQSIVSWRLEKTIEFLNNFNQASNTVIFQDEVWRYPELNQIILEHPNLQNKKIFLATTGYQTKQLNNRMQQLSYPVYFMIGARFNKKSAFNIKPTNLSFGFNCLNNRPAVHRILLGYQLLRANLLNQVLFTQDSWDRIDAEIFNTLPDFENYKKLLPIALPDSQDDRIDKRNKGPIVYHHSFYNSYCNIVTETETENVPYSLNQDLETLTEKSYKPFVAKQIPLILGCRGHIAYLKSLGFEMMEDLLPPGYDQMWTEQKISVIVDIIARGKDYIEDFYFDHLREIQHNHELYFSGNVEQTILTRIQNLIAN